ncbi:MAG: hypothetical protein HRT40_11310 [Campylobacteraceae bacterium]|nr:hypothetical protein [Campylobacteraceae bacterium]
MKNLFIIFITFLFVACIGSSSSSTSNAQVNSSYAYVTSGSTFKVIDISDLSNIQEKSSINTSSSFKVSVSDGKAYVSQFGPSDAYVSIIDISNPNSLTLLADIPKSASFGRVSDMYIEGNTAFVSDEYKGLHILDISNNTFAVQALAGVDAMSLTKIDDILYLIHQGVADGLQKFDVSTATSPQSGIINTIDVNVYSYPTSTETLHSIVEHDVNNVYVINIQNEKFVKLDASTLVNLGELEIDGYATAMIISGDYAYITTKVATQTFLMNSNFDGVKMINLNSMTIVDTYTLTNANGASVYDNKLYVTDSLGLHVFDISAGNLNHLTTFAQGAGNSIALGQ